MKKKLISLLCAAAMVFSLAACGVKTDTTYAGQTLTGRVTAMDGTAVSDNAVVTIDSGCTWILTGDCTLTSLTNNGTINFNGYTITLADGTVLQ